MEFKELFYMIGLESVFGLLFCVLLYFMFKEYRMSMKKYWTLLETQNEQHKKSKESLQNIIDENQKIMMESAKAFTSLSKDVKEIKYKLNRLESSK